MRKSELKKLKRINATPHMIELAKNNKSETPILYNSKHGWDKPLMKRTNYDIMVRCQSRGKILIVCIFLPEEIADGKITPLYEIYCNVEGNEYITRIMPQRGKEKWSTAMADNLDDVQQVISKMYWYKNVESRIWQNNEGRNTIQQRLKTN